MLVQFGNNWFQKILLTAKLDLAYGLVQFWMSSEFFNTSLLNRTACQVPLYIRIRSSLFQRFAI